ncbi:MULTISPECIES: 4-carboxymuconolactone decarboxylase [Paracoccus]|uniref:4-carboxymuconolactone decarboxylase n=1 Tax=Paracoccus TaxID=265 RepID=UPI000FD7A7ED|nr:MULTISPECIES: 4-carboxymuconolactone decarboxylase [Paracoccus]AZY92702.1 4-carboxymuconolactone decarboxylase [Paracoccus sp. Arc7-R13]TNC03939.1 4-carboxymuconolactone decarboxylase [Paracoccus marcusii]
MTELSDTGLATRIRVLGPAHVARAQAAQTPFDAPFQALITDAAWGHVWSRGTIPLRERSMMTIALLAGLGNDGELALHLRSIPNTGTSRDDVMEALLHVAIYAGVPRANHAIALARRIFAEADAQGGQA